MPVLRISLHAVLEKTTVVQIHHFTTGSSSEGNKIETRKLQGSKAVAGAQRIQSQQTSQIKVNYNTQRFK